MCSDLLSGRAANGRLAGVGQEIQNMSRFRMIVAVIVLIAVSACVPITAPERTGFLSTYENLNVVGNDRLFCPGSRVGEYTKFIIDPTVLLFTPDPEDRKFTAEELADLLAYLLSARFC